MTITVLSRENKIH